MILKGYILILSRALKECRAEKGWRQEDLAKYSGVSLPTIKRYEAGSDNATTANLKKIADAFGIDISFFLVPQVSPNVVPQSQKSVPQVSPNQENLSPKAKLESQTLNDDDFVNIPFYEDIRASAGSGAYNDIETAEQLSFPKSFLRQYFGIISFANLSIIVGSGDSMFPTLPENCYLVMQQGDVREGEICVARIDDELYVKRLQKRPKLKLLSDNKAYDNIELEGENFEILGRVVGYFKKTSL